MVSRVTVSSSSLFLRVLSVCCLKKGLAFRICIVFCCQIMEEVMVYKLYFRRMALAIRQGTFHGYIPARGFSNK